MDYLSLVLRWIHLLSAITLVGGALFAFLVLRPWLATLPEDQRQRVQQSLRARWAAVIFTGIALLLITGLVNIMRINAQLPPDVRKTYHPLLGIKVLVALGVFFLASALAGKSEAFEKLRAHWGRTLGVVVLLGVVVVLISGYLRVMRDQGAASAPPDKQAINRPAELPETGAPDPRPFWLLQGRSSGEVAGRLVQKPIAR